jgi:hypothetical protein
MNATHPRPLPFAPWGTSSQFLALVGLAATALALLTTAQEGVALAFAGQPVPWTGLLKARLVDWYACAIFMPGLFWLAQRYPIRRDRWQQHLPICLLAGVPVAIAKEALFVAVGNLFRPGVFDLATILSEDLSYEVMAVWAFLAVAQLWAFLVREARPDVCAGDASSFIQVRTRRGFERVRTADIEFVDAQGNYAQLVTPNGRYLVRETMARMEARLGSAFIRVHRSLIVQRACVTRLETTTNGGYWIHLASGACLRSGRSYREAIRSSGIAGDRA